MRELSSFLTSVLLYRAHLFSGMSAIAVERLNEKQSRNREKESFILQAFPKDKLLKTCIE